MIDTTYRLLFLCLFESKTMTDKQIKKLRKENPTFKSELGEKVYDLYTATCLVERVGITMLKVNNQLSFLFKYLLLKNYYELYGNRRV